MKNGKQTVRKDAHMMIIKVHKNIQRWSYKNKTKRMGKDLPWKYWVEMILILNQVDFTVRNITQNKEGHFVMVMGSIFQGDKIILHLYLFINKLQNLKQNWKILKCDIEVWNNQKGEYSLCNWYNMKQTILEIQCGRL